MINEEWELPHTVTRGDVIVFVFWLNTKQIGGVRIEIWLQFTMSYTISFILNSITRNVSYFRFD